MSDLYPDLEVSGHEQKVRDWIERYESGEDIPENPAVIGRHRNSGPLVLSDDEMKWLLDQPLDSHVDVLVTNGKPLLSEEEKQAEHLRSVASLEDAIKIVKSSKFAENDEMKDWVVATEKVLSDLKKKGDNASS